MSDDKARTRITTAWVPSYYCVGDTIEIIRMSRWQRIRKLLLKPRVLKIVSVTNTFFEIEERRMTWREWRLALKRAFTWKK